MVNYVYEECYTCKHRSNIDIELCESCEANTPSKYEYDPTWDQD
jgi:hypothetical protein